MTTKMQKIKTIDRQKQMKEIRKTFEELLGENKIPVFGKTKQSNPSKIKREPVVVEIGKAYTYAYKTAEGNGAVWHLDNLELEQVDPEQLYASYLKDKYSDVDIWNDKFEPGLYLYPHVGMTCMVCNIVVHKNGIHSVLHNKDFVNPKERKDVILLINNKFYVQNEEDFAMFVKEIK